MRISRYLFGTHLLLVVCTAQENTTYLKGFNVELPVCAVSVPGVSCHVVDVVETLFGQYYTPWKIY